MPIDADAAKIAQCERVAKMRVAKKGRRGNQRLALKKKKHATKIKVIAAELECKPHPQMVRRGPRFRPENSQSAREGQATNSQLRKESSKAMAQVPEWKEVFFDGTTRRQTPFRLPCQCGRDE
mmetsp:Transcript_38480/g.92138  ORF Transcript_38480/g.92138 Transcript_38480/m.92138 type:complete len:123 (+) Transcript_38480:222-590(+)